MNIILRFIYLINIYYFKTKSVEKIVPGFIFISPSVLNFIATIAQYLALEIVYFPQFASAKCLRIAVIALIVFKQTKEKILWVVISLLTSHFIFMYEFKMNNNNENWNLFGFIWLLLFILSDSFTGIKQQEIFKKFGAKPLTMMFWINIFNIALLIPQLFEEDMVRSNFAIFITNFNVWLYLFGSGLFGFLVQFFTIRMIYQFGVFYYILSVTFRIILFIIVSRIIFKHEITVFEICELSTIWFLIGLNIFISGKNTEISSWNKQASEKLDELEKNISNKKYLKIST